MSDYSKLTKNELKVQKDALKMYRRYLPTLTLKKQQLQAEIRTIEAKANAVRNEREDELFYDRLLEQAPTDKEKEIITSIRNDERKHNKILRDLYYNFTGQVIQADMSMPNINNTSTYKENLEKALFGELDAVVKYRKILGTMPSGNSYTLLMSIMTDELRHASKYNFLIHNAK